MKVRVFRFNADTGETGFSDYELPFGPERGYTLLTIIHYIHENIDPTLSSISHCVCDRGICGRCVMNVNGKPRLACAYVPDTAELTVNPKNRKFFKDLVCD
jgi:succinate dehydrogenase / fumarate reductase iron-sulfur subunit